MRRRELIVGLAGIACSGAAPATLTRQPELPGPLGTFRAIEVNELDGRPSTLGRLLGAPRPAVVSFWATWCAPCAVEGRKLAEIRSRVPDARLAIVGVNVDRDADPARLDQFRHKARMNYTQGLNGHALYQAMTRQPKVLLPRTFVFDAAGQPRAAFGRYFGSRTLDAIDAAVREVLA